MPVGPLEAPPSLALPDDEGEVQQSTVGLHPSPRRRVEEVGEEPRVEEGVLGAQMGMVEYHVIVGGGGWYT